MDYAVIMAGGTGKRLWPLSRQDRPKQVLKLLEGQTLLRKCYQRLAPVFDNRNIIILTNAGYVDLIREDLPELPPGNVIAEPAVRDTAAAIGLAAAVLAKYDPHAVMVVLSADHVIEPAETLQQAIKDAITFINKNPQALITFGIKPAFPSTQLGYLQLAEPQSFDQCENRIYTVSNFREKPDSQTAQQYLRTDKYCWNSGIFVWKARNILDNLFNYLPGSKEPLTKIQAAWETPQQNQLLNEWFPKIPKISIDFAVMEKAKHVHAIKLNCRWLDIGSFVALADLIAADKNNNVIVGSSEMLDSTGNVIVTEDQGHLIACISLQNMIVAHSSDATLVCPVDQTEKLKQLLEQIKQNSGEKFL
ncbi:MAG: sugar phosphate nucleotidyltransferase [Planctomycetota bacterium]